MSDLVHLSRSFVEFGPFSSAEVVDFQKRGLLQPTDYLRNEGSEPWLHVEEWFATCAPAKAAASKDGAKKAATKPKAKAPSAAKKAKSAA